MISSNMARRLAVAAVGIPAAAAAILAGGWVLTAVIAFLGVAGTHEFLRLARERGVQPLPLMSYGAAACIPVLVQLVVSGHVRVEVVLALLPAWVIALGLTALATRGPEQAPLAATAISLFAPAYTAGMSSGILVLRHSALAATPVAGMLLVLLPLAMTWICDSVAMWVGGMVGGPRFAPVVSPKKTWSGTIGGAIAAVALAPVYARLVLQPAGVDLPLAVLLLTGLIAGTIGQYGDLAESLYKREAGVKDSGSFFPGHGGVLDRLDSLYWVIPMTTVVFFAFGVL